MFYQNSFLLKFVTGFLWIRNEEIKYANYWVGKLGNLIRRIVGIINPMNYFPKSSLI